MRISDWSSDVCSSDLGYDERSPWTVKQESDPQRDKKDAHVTAVPLTILWVRVALYGAFIFLGGSALSQTGDAIAGQTGITSRVVGFALRGAVTYIGRACCGERGLQSV